jgi:hypothetical protein
MRFEVHGAERETGKERVFTLNCATSQEARQKANAAGYLVGEVVPVSVSPKFRHRRFNILALVMLGAVVVGGIVATAWKLGHQSIAISDSRQDRQIQTLPSVSQTGARIPAEAPAPIIVPATQSVAAQPASEPLTSEEVSNFAKDFAQRLEHNIVARNGEKVSASVTVRKTDLLRTQSLIRPVVGSVIFERLVTIDRGRDRFRLTRELFEMTVARSGGLWELVDGSHEIVTDFQIPEALTPSTAGNKGNILGDAAITLIFTQMRLERLRSQTPAP